MHACLIRFIYGNEVLSLSYSLSSPYAYAYSWLRVLIYAFCVVFFVLFPIHGIIDIWEDEV